MMGVSAENVFPDEDVQTTQSASRAEYLRFPRRKFIAPQLPRIYVPEETLLPFVLDLDSWRVCLLDVSAGYGKTALMRQWYDALEGKESCHALWMELDNQDSDAFRFACALCHLFGTFDAEFFSLRESGGEYDTEEDVLVDVINLADLRLDENEEYVVFFDDYDCAASPALDRALLFLNKYAGDNFHFVIAGSRLSPAIDDMLLDSSVLEFRNKDLRFSHERARAYANAAFPGITDEEFCKLEEGIGSWPTGWVFCYLARQRAEGSDWKMRLRSYCARFFEKEVMEVVEPRVYEFLVETAFLEELHPELCDAIVGSGQARGILDGLVSGNLFVRYDSDDDVYLHQPMFREFLVDKFLSLAPGTISRFAETASEWYFRKDMSAQRAKALALATDPIYVQSTIKDSVGLEWQGEYESFTEFLIAQPASAYLEEPYLIWVSIWSFIAAGLVDEAREWLALAEPLSQSDADKNAFAYADAICMALEGDSASSLEKIKGVLDESENLAHGFQCLLIHMEAEDVERLGNVQESRDLFLRAVSLAEREDGIFYKLFDLYLLAHHYLVVGDFEETMTYVMRARPECEGSSSLRNEFSTIEAFVRMERGDLGGAAEILAEGLSSLSSSMNADMYVHAMIALARLNRLRNNPIEALEILNDACETIKRRRIPRNLDMELYAYRAVYALEVGDLAVANISESAIDGFLNSPDAFRVIPCMLAKALLMWSRHDDSAYGMLSACREIIQRCESNYYLALSYVIEARMLGEAGDGTGATICVNRAIELSMRNGYRSIFVLGGALVREILFKIVTSRKTSTPIRSYTKEILLSFGSEAEVESDISLREGDVTGYYSLTSREREILGLLNNGMSRYEISQMLSLSQNTVKSHLKNIYSKLGVHTRSEAYKASQAIEPAEGEL